MLRSTRFSSNAISNAKDQFRHFVQVRATTSSFCFSTVTCMCNVTLPPQAYAHSHEHEIFKFQHLHFMAFQYKMFAQLLESSQTPSFSSKRRSWVATRTIT